MADTVAKAFVFLLVVLAVFLWVGYTITEMIGGGKRETSVAEISPESGEAIFWGKGRCYTCHSLGDRGSAVRGPNQGRFGDESPLAIGARAAVVAKARSETTGLTYTRTDYLVESLADPGVYLIEGFKDEMSNVYAPPISLSLDEIKAVVSFLQTQGGDLDLEAINNPTEITKKFYDKISAASAAGGGDPDDGAVVFADTCSDCHSLKGEGGGIGPDLSAISRKGLRFISESILSPATVITEGFETYEVVDNEGRKTIGLKTRDDATEIDITKATGEVVTIAKADIKEITENEIKSVMPDDLSEALTVKDFQDILAFMILQKGE